MICHTAIAVDVSSSCISDSRISFCYPVSNATFISNKKGKAEFKFQAALRWYFAYITLRFSLAHYSITFSNMQPIRVLLQRSSFHQSKFIVDFIYLNQWLDDGVCPSFILPCLSDCLVVCANILNISF